MDLPPPPFFPRPDHRDTRYANFIHPCDLQPSSHHLPPQPPPQLPPPNVLFPPPLPPPHVAYHSVPHRFAFSPPHHFIPERAYPHEFDPPSKPYRGGSAMPFPPPRESIPFNHDYVARSPIFRDEVYYRESTDDLIDRSALSMTGRSSGRSSQVRDVGASERFGSTFCHGRGSYNEWDDDERRWDNDIDYQGSKFIDKRDYAANRRDTNNWGRKWYNEWVDDERRWDYGANAQGYELHNVRNDDRRIHDYLINDRGCEFYSQRDDYQRRHGYGINDRGCELYNERDVLGFDRFSGRLGRRVSNEDFARDSKKRRVQKMRTLDRRIELEKACKKRRRGYHFQHTSKETNNKSFRGGKEKEVFKSLETRKEDTIEREQSPLELSISFESNGLVARAILTPSSSSPAGKSNMDLTPNNDSRKVNINSCSPSAKSSVDMVKTNALNHGLDTQSDANGTSESNASGSGRLTTNANDIGENPMENGNLEDLKSEGANPTQICRLQKKKKATKRPMYKIPEENETLGDIKSQGANHVGYWRARSRRLRKMMRAKNKRLHGCNLETTNDCGKIMNDNIIAPSGASEHETNVYLSKTNEVSDAVLLPSTVAAVSKNVDHDIHVELVGCKKETILDDGNIGDGLVFSKHSDDVNMCVWNSDLELNSDKTSLRTDRDDDFMRVPFHDSVCSSSSQESINLSALEANCSVLEKAGNVTISDVGSADATEGEVCDRAAVADCSNVNLATPSNSTILSVVHKGVSDESSNSVVYTMIEQSCEDEANLSHKNGFTEGLLEATEASIDHSPRISRKRKASYDQMDHSGPKTNEHLSTVSFSNGEVGKVLLKDCISSEPVDFPCERNSCEENDSSSEGPSEDPDLSLDVGSGVDGSSCKKKKVDSSSCIYSTDQSELALQPAVLSEERFSTNNISDSDELSCPSSPEDLLLFSDFSSPINTKASPSQSRNDMMYGTGRRTFNRRPVSAECNSTMPLQKSLNKAISNSVHTNRAIASPVTFPMVQKSNFTHGKLTFSKNQPTSTASKAFLGYPQKFNTSRTSPSTQVTKSKSWHRTGSVAVTTPKLQPSLPPQNSYVRKGNSLMRTPSPSSAPSPGFQASRSSLVYRASPSIDDLKKGQAFKSNVDAPSLQRKPSPSSAVSPGFHVLSSSVYRLSPSTDGLNKGQASKSRVDGIDAPQILQRKPSPSSAVSPGFHTLSSSIYRLSPSTDGLKKGQGSKRVDGIDATPSLQRKPSPSSVISPGLNALRSSVYRLSPSIDRLQPVNTSVRAESLSLGHSGKSLNSATCNLGDYLPVTNPTTSGCSGNLDILHEAMKSCAIPEGQNGSDNQSTPDDEKSGKKITYVKRKSNQLVAASDSEENTRPSLADGYYKSKKNQLVRTLLGNQSTRRDAMVNVDSRFRSQVLPLESSRKRQLGKGKGFQKTFRSSKFSFVWKLHEDARSSEKHKISERPQKVFSRLFPWKRSTYRRSFMLALGSKPNNKTFSTISQKMLLSRKRGAVYTRSSHGYSLRMSKVFSVGGSGLKWSKSLEKNSKKANEDATRAVAAAEKKKKEENVAGAIVSKTRNRVSRKLVPNVKLRPGERIFRIGSERYKMDATRRSLHRITAAEEKPSTSAPLPPEKDVKISYVPRRLFIGSNEYVRIGNGNQLVRDPKKRTRILASEKVRWSLRTVRLRWAKKKKYCLFFTKFGKCNKEDGKCPYIHDRTKIVVCTKFLSGSCSNPDCKLTHEVIPERMQDCSYFLKGSCSNENCPYRHVNVDPDSPVCESFLRGYCADGNECRKKHTYVCPAFEATGICPQVSTCKLHHPKKKTEKKPATEETIVRGRYFDGGLIDLTDNNSIEASKRVSEKGKDENQQGKFPDFISLDVSDDEMEHDVVMRQACEDN